MKLQFKHLVSVFALAFIFTSAIAQDDPATHKHDTAISAVVAQPVSLEVKEHLKVDDAEFKSAVITNSDSSLLSFGLAGVALIGLVSAFVSLFRRFKHLFTVKNAIAVGCVAVLLAIVFIAPENSDNNALAFTGAIPLANQLKALTEQKFDKIKEMKSLITKSEEEKRNLKSEEEKQYNSLKQEVEDLTARITRLNDQHNIELGQAGKGSYSENSDSEEAESRVFNILKRTPIIRNRPVTDWYLRNHDVNEELRKADVFKMLAALATGEVRDDATARALAESRSVTGSALLNPFLSSQLWDAGLSKSHLAQSGMKIVPLESNEHKMAKITTYPTFEWAAESAATTDKSTVFSSSTFSAKTLRGFVKASGELLQDGLNTEQALSQVFSKSAGNSIDDAGLFGSGTGATPQGIFNYANVNVHSMGTNGAALADYDPYLEAIKLIYDDNGQTPMTSIMAPRTWLTQSKFKDTTDQPLALPPAIKDMKFLESSKVPVNQTQGSASNASCVIMGGFESLYLGVRLDIQVLVSPVKSDTFEYEFLTVFRGDFKPEREEAFAVIKGIIP